MRTALVIAVVGCSTPSAAPDAAPPDVAADAHPDPYDRTVNQVLLADDFIFWSHGRFGCPLEDPCIFDGPAVTAWWRGSGNASPRYSGGVGARGLVGTSDERFFVTGLELETMYLVRDRGAPTALSVPRPYTIGPAIDATHVYWADATDPAAGYTIRRATRAGDGSDAIVLATGVRPGGLDALVYAAGYVWWNGGVGVYRVPVTGGVPESVAPALATSHVHVLTARGDDVYVASSVNGPVVAEVTSLGRIDATGAYTLLAEHAPRTIWTRFLVAADDALYWSTRDGNIYRAPLAGGAVETIPVDDRVGYAFAVLPDQLLVEFTADGFRAIPR